MSESNGQEPSSAPMPQLRELAEASVRPRRPGAELAPEDSARLIHELEVHQIELKLQAEELRRVQGKLEASLERYRDPNDFAHKPIDFAHLLATIAGLPRAAGAPRPRESRAVRLHSRPAAQGSRAPTKMLRMRVEAPYANARKGARRVSERPGTRSAFHTPIWRPGDGLPVGQSEPWTWHSDEISRETASGANRREVEKT